MVLELVTWLRGEVQCRQCPGSGAGRRGEAGTPSGSPELLDSKIGRVGLGRKALVTDAGGLVTGLHWGAVDSHASPLARSCGGVGSVSGGWDEVWLGRKKIVVLSVEQLRGM